MTPQVLEKLKSVEARYEQLSELVSDSSVQADQPTYRTHAKALAEIQPLVEKSREYRHLQQQLDEAREMAGSGDEEFKALAEEEAKRITPRLAALLEEIRVLLIPRDPNDDKNVVLEIRGGTGGDEAALFAADLFRMYSRYAERKGWRVEVLSMNETGVGGIKEVVASIEGRGVYGRLRHESGVHRVQRVPATEASGRIHTSTATVAVLPEAEEVDIHIDAKDLRIDTFCSSGPGGQSVNTTYSAIRITHLPTNTVVSQQDEKSQVKNRAKAMKVLRSRLYEMELRKQQDAIAKERRGQVGTGERSEKIRTYNFKENRVTDHRVNFTMHQLALALDGNLDDLIDQMVSATEQERLKAATETDAPAERSGDRSPGDTASGHDAG
jgi:peptide chain release factor 1